MGTASPPSQGRVYPNVPPDAALPQGEAAPTPPIPTAQPAFPLRARGLCLTAGSAEEREEEKEETEEEEEKKEEKEGEEEKEETEAEP